MFICNLSRIIHHTWGQQSGKKGKNLFYATIDDLIRAFQQQSHYKMHLMGRLEGTWPNHTKLCLKAHINSMTPKDNASNCRFHIW
jgi:hypothetical protein